MQRSSSVSCPGGSRLLLGVGTLGEFDPIADDGSRGYVLCLAVTVLPVSLRNWLWSGPCEYVTMSCSMCADPGSFFSRLTPKCDPPVNMYQGCIYNVLGMWHRQTVNQLE